MLVIDRAGLWTRMAMRQILPRLLCPVVEAVVCPWVVARSPVDTRDMVWV